MEKLSAKFAFFFFSKCSHFNVPFVAAMLSENVPCCYVLYSLKLGAIGTRARISYSASILQNWSRVALVENIAGLLRTQLRVG